VEFTDYDTRLAAYAVIVDEEDRILLALWNEGPVPQWTLPGGGVELEETVEQAAVREVREESGYDVTLGALLGIDSWVIPPAERIFSTSRPMKSVRVLFEGTVTGGVLTREVGGTTDECRWFPLEEVPGLPHVRIVDTALRLLDPPVPADQAR
jgi:8-oxo-dGTP diphosphatase